jgi:hypothetical protein
MTNDSGGLFGAIVGIGLGLYTLKLLSNLNSQEKSEIETILSKSKSLGQGFGWSLEVNNSNLLKARSILNRTGFYIVAESPSEYRKTTYILFKERKR